MNSGVDVSAQVPVFSYFEMERKLLDQVVTLCLISTGAAALASPGAAPGHTLRGSNWGSADTHFLLSANSRPGTRRAASVVVTSSAPASGDAEHAFRCSLAGCKASREMSTQVLCPFYKLLF